jgi:hypothetical protein
VAQRVGDDPLRRTGAAGMVSAELGFEFFVMRTNIEHFPETGKKKSVFQNLILILPIP